MAVSSPRLSVRKSAKSLKANPRAKMKPMVIPSSRKIADFNGEKEFLIEKKYDYFENICWIKLPGNNLKL
jgi:hypothetical protein